LVTSYVERAGKSSTSYGELNGGGLEDFLIKNEANASLLFRKKCWEDTGGYDENVPGFEDWDFFISATKHGWHIHSIPEYLFYHRELNDSRFDNDFKKRPEIVKYIVQKHKTTYQENIVDVIYEKEKLIKELKMVEETYKNSFSLKIGNLILIPFRSMRKLLGNGSA